MQIQDTYTSAKIELQALGRPLTGIRAPTITKEIKIHNEYIYIVYKLTGMRTRNRLTQSPDDSYCSVICQMEGGASAGQTYFPAGAYIV